MLVKFENGMVQTLRNFELFDKKPGFKKYTNFEKAKTPFWKALLWLNQLFNAKLMICRLPYFSVPKITVIWHV